jgi:hypothetical protein
VIVNRMKILLGCELTVQGTIRGVVMTRLVRGMDQGALVAPKLGSYVFCGRVLPYSNVMIKYLGGNF